MTALASVAEATVNKVALTAHNIGWDDTRSLTDETSASELTDLGCQYVILGHSERRLYLGETNDMIARKLRTAFNHRITPILCVADTSEQHRAGRTEAAVLAQLKVLLRGYHQSSGPFLIAYEPAWAISTSQHARECEPDEAGDRHGFIRDILAAELGAELAADNAPALRRQHHRHQCRCVLTQPDIDGGLVGGGSVGGASQELISYQALIDVTVATYQRTRPGAGHEIGDRSRP